MLRIIFVAIVVLFSMPAKAQLADVITGCGTITVDSGTRRNMTIDTTASHCISLSSQYPSGSTAITGNSTGTTGAVVGTLSGASAKTTYICGFNVSGIGGTAAIGPVTIAGLIGSSMVFQLTSAAAAVNFSHSFNPCIPASATNTAITVTTTADGTATAVDVNSWGYRF
jgi:hypothetical protein